MAEFHRVVVIIIGIVDTAHHTLIITEEEDGETGDTIDGNEKTSLLQLVDDIGPGNEVHGDRDALRASDEKDEGVTEL